MFFPERIFLDARVVSGLGDYGDELAGRTPIVSVAQFSFWLAEEKSTTTRLLRPSLRTEGKLREFMIGLAMDGVASSKELEDMAARWGLAPFETEPDSSKFDVTTRATWTLPMVVAWIAWRSADAVREQWDEYRTNCWDWQSFERRLPLDGGKTWYRVDGEELVCRGPASVGQLSLLEAIESLEEGSNRPSACMAVRLAREALWNSMSDGKLSANATDP